MKEDCLGLVLAVMGNCDPEALTGLSLLREPAAYPAEGLITKRPCSLLDTDSPPACTACSIDPFNAAGNSRLPAEFFYKSQVITGSFTQPVVHVYNMNVKMHFLCNFPQEEEKAQRISSPGDPRDYGISRTDHILFLYELPDTFFHHCHHINSRAERLQDCLHRTRPHHADFAWRGHLSLAIEKSSYFSSLKTVSPS